MIISVDAGGFCTDPMHKYGNFTFTDNIIKALFKYDVKNNYYL